MLEAFLPKLQAHAHVLVFTSWRVEPVMRAVLEGVGLAVRNSLVWVKNNAGLCPAHAAFAPQHERILYAVRGEPPLLRRQPDVLHADRVVSDRHPTEKPPGLLRVLVEATTAEGELVADPFGGVASTLVAARQAGRDYWGCEIDEGYFCLGRERLEQGDGVEDRGR
jgi:site-specific DNA-methyltransferase (adenine-specific)